MGEDHFSGTVVTDDLKRPTRDSDGAGHPSSLFGLAPGGVCRATSVTGRPVRSYRTLSPLPVPHREAGPSAVYSLLHFPSPYGARALPGTLPCGARTFLRRRVRPKPSPRGDPHSRARSKLPRGRRPGPRSVRGPPLPDRTAATVGLEELEGSQALSLLAGERRVGGHIQHHAAQNLCAALAALELRSHSITHARPHPLPCPGAVVLGLSLTASRRVGRQLG